MAAATRIPPMSGAPTIFIECPLLHLEFATDCGHISPVALDTSSAFSGPIKMSHPASPPATAPSAASFALPAPNSHPRTRFGAFMTAIGAILLIGSEIWLAAVAAVWALDGFLDLAMVGDLILIALIAPLAIWATWMTARLAISAEMNPENAD